MDLGHHERRGGRARTCVPARRSQKMVPVKYIGRTDKTADQNPGATEPATALGLKICGYVAAKTEAKSIAQFRCVGRRQLQRPLPVLAGPVPVPGLVDHVSEA